MKNTSFLFLLGFVLIIPFHGSGQKVFTRKTINFDKGWMFSLGNASDPEKDFNYGISNIYSKSGKADQAAMNPNFNDKAWRMIDLPHDWAVELPFVNSSSFDVMAHGYKPIGGLFPETSIGWYKKTFTINKADSGSRFAIRFDGVFRDATFWLNGFYLGNNKSGYLGATYDLTDYIQFNKPNVITVRVDATQYEGWFYEGAGIYRHVWLLTFDPLHITQDGVFVHSNISPGKAVITTESTLENSGLVPVTFTLKMKFSDRTGKTLAESTSKTIKLENGEQSTQKLDVVVKNPRLWSLSDPYLYRTSIEVYQNGVMSDSKTIRTGIRTILMDPQNGLLLNGEEIKIKGLNNHQDHAGVGAALPDFLQYYRVQRMLDMGANAYRTSHNAPTPELLDACDSLGMLVLDENRLLNSSEEYMNQWEQLLKRDRNHPSVFLWSIGNEEGYIQTNSIGKRLAISLINKQKVLDPTRTCTYAADLPNVFNGINEVIPVRGFNYRNKYLVPYHIDHPDQPIVGTEMGSTVTTRGIYVRDTIQAYVPDQDITAPWWASRAEEWWPIAAENKWMSGGFVWTGFDYRGEPTPYSWPNINSHFGAMDVCGFPKNIFYYYQSWWADKDVLHISPHWNKIRSDRKPEDVWVNSNADSV